MTHRPIVTLADGTRQYISYHRYTPVAPEDRIYKVRRPDHPEAVRFHGDWFIPLDVIPDEERFFPETRSDEDAYYHGLKTQLCNCHVCRRPEAQRFRIRAREGLAIYGGKARRG